MTTTLIHSLGNVRARLEWALTSANASSDNRPTSLLMVSRALHCLRPREALMHCNLQPRSLQAWKCRSTLTFWHSSPLWPAVGFRGSLAG